MLKKVKKAIYDFNMISEGDSVLCCLSGGADSVSLLLCLCELGYNVKACHLNHMLRGDESDRDEQFCRDLCYKCAIQLTVKRVNVAKYSEKNGLSIEMGAREVRYAFFSEIACDKIATAHTLSDSYETAIFNLTRGTGIKGLCGIPPVRENIIRPLIYCSRKDIENFLSEKGQVFVTDSTNLSNDYSRNLIRNKVIPELKTINESAIYNFSHASKLLASDMSFIEKLADDAYKKSQLSDDFYDAKYINSLDFALKSRVVIKILNQHDFDCSYDRVNEILNIIEYGGKINIAAEKYIVCNNEKIRITGNHGDADSFISLSPEINVKYDFFEKKVMLLLCENNEGFRIVNRKFANCVVDYGKIKGEILLHNRKKGSKIKLAGRNFTSTVKNLLNQSVLPENRSKVIMLSDEVGLIFIEGFGAAERVKIDSSTKCALICEIS